MTFDRRRLLQTTGALALGFGALPPSGLAAAPMAAMSGRTGTPIGKADHTIEIGNGLLALGSETAVSTKLYNNQFPGPLLRLQEGKPVTVDVRNNTDSPEQLHWHGQTLPAAVDGAAEEGTPYIPPHSTRRIAFTPGPSGFRFYHSHLTAGTDLSVGLYSGQAGPVFIAPKHDPGAYDREVFVTFKEFGPSFTRMEMPDNMLAPAPINPALRDAALKALDASTRRGLPQAYDVSYQFYTINGRMLGEGPPIAVKAGERVLFHVLNASATESHSLALPGHAFRVVALDGNPVPRPAAVPVLWLGPAERVSAIVDMRTPGKWIMGDIDDDARGHGAGIVVEYAKSGGKPVWTKPADARWDYRLFGAARSSSPPPDETITMTFAANPGARNGFDEFTINGVAFSMDRMDPLFDLSLGRRYRLHMRNATDDAHPVHLHRHTFELTGIAGRPTAGVRKDVVMIGGFQEMTVDFLADQPGLSLFHCHMQHHMDFGFMALIHCR
ncbi:MAG: multicopper oxidase domain-containing protein [Rhizomicrobium sp.]